jgi:G2/mitotic-specific cyclin 2
MIKRAFQDITNLSAKNIKLTIHKSSHRKKLVRWLYEVCKDFRYSQYTYATAILIADRFTKKNGFDIDEYQLIGISSLFLAAKIEEPTTRKASEYSIVTAGSYSTKEILKMEAEILDALEYDLMLKLPHSYFNIDYFNLKFPKEKQQEMRALLNSIIACFLERSEYNINNMVLVYLEAVKELEKIFKSQRIEEDIKFYIENGNESKEILINKIV